MKRKDLSSEERTFLELIARNVWQARREGVLIGVAYTLFVGFFSYAAFSDNPYRFLAIICYMTIITVTLVLWLKVINPP